MVASAKAKASLPGRAESLPENIPSLTILPSRKKAEDGEAPKGRPPALRSSRG